MFESIDNVEDLQPLSKNWAIKVRIIHLWKSPSVISSSDDFSLQMILCDQKGGCIQADVSNKLISDINFNLEAGRVILLSNFTLISNRGLYKSCMHLFKIRFKASTVVKILEDDPNISLHGFNFSPYPDITSNAHDDNFLVDVIGMLTYKRKMHHYIEDGEAKKSVDIELTDLQGNKLQCILRDPLCQMLQDYLKNTGDKTIIIVLQWFKIKTFEGDSVIRSVYNIPLCSRMFINLHVQECQDFILRFFDFPVKDLFSNCGGCNLKFSDDGIEDDILTLTVARTISSLRKYSSEIKSCVVLGVVITIDRNKGWCYNSCKRCNKKVSYEIKGFFCLNRGQFVYSVVPRYMIEVKVYDESGYAVFVLFDEEVNQLIRCSASELINQSVAENGAIPDFPDRLNGLVGMKLLFKLGLNTPYSHYKPDPKYIVIGVSDNDRLKAMYNIYKDDDEDIFWNKDHAALKDTFKRTPLIDLEQCSIGYLSPLKNLDEDLQYNQADENVDTAGSSGSKKLKTVHVEPDY